MCDFQCELCHFRNMESRDPNEDGADDTVLRYIRRANLDMFWVRRPGTVYLHFLEMRAMIADAEDMQTAPSFPERGLMALKDTSDMGPAVLLLKKFLRLGQYNAENLTFGTTRERRGVIST